MNCVLKMGYLHEGFSMPIGLFISHAKVAKAYF